MDFWRRKSKRRKTERFLEQVGGAAPNELLYVGDLSSDITAARAARVQVSGIARQESARELLVHFNSDYLFSSLDDLPNKKGEII